MDNYTNAAVRKFYKGVCQYCGATDANHVDHITPISRGGADDVFNVTLSCRACNNRKAAAEFDPMFLAIAHARARDNAGKITALRRREPAAPKPPAEPKQPRPPRDPFGPKFRLKMVRLYGEEEADRRMREAITRANL